MCKQMFVCDPASGRALIGASCPDIGELGLANIYDDRDEIARSHDPLRRFVPIEEIGEDWDEDMFLDSVFPKGDESDWDDDDCDDADADADFDVGEELDHNEAQAPWWYDEVRDDTDADEDYDDEEEDEVELTADQLDAMAMAELIRSRMSGPDYSRRGGIQPAERQYRGRQWARHKVGAGPRPACKRQNCFALLIEAAA